MAETDFTIIIDTREQHPFLFDEFDVATVCQTMASGDYGVLGLPDVTVERKSGPDLYGCMSGMVACPVGVIAFSAS